MQGAVRSGELGNNPAAKFGTVIKLYAFTAPPPRYWIFIAVSLLRLIALLMQHEVHKHTCKQRSRACAYVYVCLCFHTTVHIRSIPSYVEINCVCSFWWLVTVFAISICCFFCKLLIAETKLYFFTPVDLNIFYIYSWK